MKHSRTAMLMADAGTERFALTKWYLDCVDAHGRTAIAYWASLNWRTLALVWHSVGVYEPDRPAEVRTSMAHLPEPEFRGGRLSWASLPLSGDVTFQSTQPPMGARLIDDADGAIVWECVAPSAVATIRVAGHEPVSGAGYAERLVITRLPWHIPLDRLRWGRWIDTASDRSVVWIDWAGAQAATWVFVDGVPQSGASVADTTIGCGDTTLSLCHRRTLESRTLDDVIRLIAPLRNLLPAPLRALRETKWCSAGVWQNGEHEHRTGWAVHEQVDFR